MTEKLSKDLWSLLKIWKVLRKKADSMSLPVASVPTSVFPQGGTQNISIVATQSLLLQLNILLAKWYIVLFLVITSYILHGRQMNTLRMVIDK